MTPAALWLQFAAVTVLVLVASQFLTRSAEAIGLRTGIGRTFAGVALLATATSLPEMATGLSAVTIVDAPDLAAGNAFGANLYNLVIIALIDVSRRRSPVLSTVGPEAAIVGALSIAVIALAGAGPIIHRLWPGLSAWTVSPLSPALLTVYLAGLAVTLGTRKGQADLEPARPAPGVPTPLWRHFLTYAAAAVVVGGSGFWLSVTGERIADTTGLGTSYVGTQFVALSTTLPELSVAIAAMRMGAPDLAVSNLLGSNLFNMGVILFLDDVAMGRPGLWASISEVHALTAAMAVVMTSVVLVSVLAGSRQRVGRYFSATGLLLVSLYALSNYLVSAQGSE